MSQMTYKRHLTEGTRYVEIFQKVYGFAPKGPTVKVGNVSFKVPDFLVPSTNKPIGYFCAVQDTVTGKIALGWSKANTSAGDSFMKWKARDIARDSAWVKLGTETELIGLSLAGIPLVTEVEQGLDYSRVNMPYALYEAGEFESFLNRAAAYFKVDWTSFVW